jgi:hypothetical protein
MNNVKKGKVPTGLFLKIEHFYLLTLVWITGWVE